MTEVSEGRSSSLLQVRDREEGFPSAVCGPMEGEGTVETRGEPREGCRTLVHLRREDLCARRVQTK